MLFDGVDHTAPQPSVGRFELVGRDGSPVGRDLVTQDYPCSRQRIIPIGLFGNIVVETAVCFREAGRGVVSQGDEYHAVRGFCSVSGDGLLVGRQHLGRFDVAGRNVADVAYDLPVDYVYGVLRRSGKDPGEDQCEQEYELFFIRFVYPQNGFRPRNIAFRE